MPNIHFIRPLWLMAFFLVLFLAIHVYRRKMTSSPWVRVCDPHLLPEILEPGSQRRYFFDFLPIWFFLSSVIIALAGPTWSQYPSVTYQTVVPRVVILDLSTAVLKTDLSPNRLERAKFKLHDLFQKTGLGMVALLVYTNEAFVISPLTEDAKTIDALIAYLNPNLMPIQGSSLNKALDEAKNLIKQASFDSGQILVLTAQAPKKQDIAKARLLASQGIDTSVMPLVAGQSDLAFGLLAKAGKGQLLALQDSLEDLDQFLAMSKAAEMQSQSQKLLVWKDQGRWFLIPGLLSFLMFFQRGWVLRLRL